ncbi:MAG: transposase [Chthoniobacter sp.]
MAEALAFFDGRHYRLGTWAIMPNHVHALVLPLPEFTLGKIVQSWKSFTARTINQRLGRTGDFWQRETYDHIVRSEESLRAFERYIRGNPVKARLREGEFLLGVGSAGESGPE